jgi:hypothetical protein
MTEFPFQKEKIPLFFLMFFVFSPRLPDDCRSKETGAES